jgi:hypothetical protein
MKSKLSALITFMLLTPWLLNGGCNAFLPLGSGSGNNPTPPSFAVTFAAPAQLATDVGPSLFNFTQLGGQATDLISLNSAGTISVLLSKSNVDFLPNVNYFTCATPPCPAPIAWAFADFDKANGMDVAVVSNAGLTVLLNNGVGVFTSGTITTAATPTAIIVADFNGDTFPDIAVAESSGQVEIFLNDKTGVFTSPGTAVAVGSKPVAMATADFNGDNKVDLAVVNSGDATVTILFGKNDGTFGTPATLTKTVQTNPVAIVVADLDGASGPDLAVLNQNSASVSVLLNQGSGAFAEAVNYTVGAGPTQLMAVDLNGDNFPDLVTLNMVDDTISVLINDKADSHPGTFLTAVPYDTGTNPVALAIGDLNNDNKLDIVTANFSSNDVSVFMNDGSGGFEQSQVFPVGKAPKSLLLADINGDNKPEILVSVSSDNAISILLQQ